LVAVTATIIFQESVFAAGGPPTRSVTPTPPTGTHQAPRPAIATPPAPTPIIRNSTSGNATSGNTTK